MGCDEQTSLRSHLFRFTCGTSSRMFCWICPPLRDQRCKSLWMSKNGKSWCLRSGKAIVPTCGHRDSKTPTWHWHLGESLFFLTFFFLFLVKQKEQKGMEKKNSVQTQNEDPNFSRSVLHFLIFILHWMIFILLHKKEQQIWLEVVWLLDEYSSLKKCKINTTPCVQVSGWCKVKICMHILRTTKKTRKGFRVFFSFFFLVF